MCVYIYRYTSLTRRGQEAPREYMKTYKIDFANRSKLILQSFGCEPRNMQNQFRIIFEIEIDTFHSFLAQGSVGPPPGGPGSQAASRRRPLRDRPQQNPGEKLCATMRRICAGYAPETPQVSPKTPQPLGVPRSPETRDSGEPKESPPVEESLGFQRTTLCRAGTCRDR